MSRRFETRCGSSERLRPDGRSSVLAGQRPATPLGRCSAALDSERQVDALLDVYGQDAKDVDWIPKAAKDGYAVISVDRAQVKKSPEKAALRASRVTAVYLGPFFAKRKYWGKVEWLVRHWPTIAGWIEASPRGTIGSARENGTIRTLAL